MTDTDAFGEHAPAPGEHAPAPAEHAPQHRRRASARVRRRRLLLAIAAVVLLIVGAVSWYAAEANPFGAPGRPVIIDVRQDEPFREVVDALAARGVVDSSLAFRIDTMLTGTPSVSPGYYELRENSSFSTIRSVLDHGPNALAMEVTPGETTLEMSDDLAGIEDASFASAFLHLARTGAVASPFQPRRGASLEGLLGTGLYILVAKENPRTLLDQMVRGFDREAAAIGFTPSTRRAGLDAYGIVTAASIVEKEGYYPRNMPRTATVIYNRLSIGMPLQMDSTVEYALGQDGGPVTSRTEHVRSLYNTYLHTGLTPTPICSVSLTALRAALHPPRGPWLFFTLISPDGTMAFAATFAEQLANERLGARRGV